MPRRARPSYRAPPHPKKPGISQQLPALKKEEKGKTNRVDAVKPINPRPPLQTSSTSKGIEAQAGQNDIDHGEEGKDEEESFLERSSEPERDGIFSFEQEVDEESDDDEQPRAIQWVDEDDLEDSDSTDQNMEEDVESQSSSTKPNHNDKLQNLDSQLSSLPLGALLRARQELSQNDDPQRSEASHSAAGESTSDDESSDDEDAASTPNQAPQLEYKLPQDRKKVAKRTNKHAPVEMTSKKPTTRRRTVVEINKIDHRDPRFSKLTGEFSSQEFRNAYSFLPDLQQSELRTLKTTLQAARKQASRQPQHQRRVSEVEVHKLENTVKRMESIVERNKRESREAEVLLSAKRKQKEKMKATARAPDDGGKGPKPWFMKDSEKRQVLLQSKYDQLEKEGGARAVKKAILKKQMKASQKEKRARPYFASAARNDTTAAASSGEKHPASRRGSEGGGQRAPKRRKFD